MSRHRRRRIRQGGINTLCTGGDLAVIYVSARNPTQPPDSIHVGLPTVGATKLLRTSYPLGPSLSRPHLLIGRASIHAYQRVRPTRYSHCPGHLPKLLWTGFGS